MSDYTLTLTRDGSNEMGTFGELTGYRFHSKTVERPWLDNKPFVSCIPATTLRWMWDKRPRTGRVLCLVNEAEGIYQYEHPNAKRSSILVHPANYMEQLLGCVAPGMSLGVVDGRWAVRDSGIALNNLFAVLDAEGATGGDFIIKWRTY